MHSATIEHLVGSWSANGLLLRGIHRIRGKPLNVVSANANILLAAKCAINGSTDGCGIAAKAPLAEQAAVPLTVFVCKSFGFDDDGLACQVDALNGARYPI